MPDIERVTRPPDPTVEIIRRAVNAAHDAGITVSTVPDLGVHCTSTMDPRWEVEQRVQVVSPLGAVLLALQPHIVDADAALSHVLGVGKLWVIGFDDAVGGAKQVSEASRLYGDGFAAGVEFRAIMHRRAGVPVERADDQPTAPIPGGTPAALLAEAIGILAVSEVLEALAESIPGRGWDADESADCAIELRALAEDYRDAGR